MSTPPALGCGTGFPWEEGVAGALSGVAERTSGTGKCSGGLDEKKTAVIMARNFEPEVIFMSRRYRCPFLEEPDVPGRARRIS